MVGQTAADVPVGLAVKSADYKYIFIYFYLFLFFFTYLLYLLKLFC